METTNRKTVLVLTDFSENATSAAETGLILSAKLRADLLLFNTCVDYSLSSFGVGNSQVLEISSREQVSTEQLAQLKQNLEVLADKLTGEDPKPQINIKPDDGDLGLSVADIIVHQNIELVVMGARGHDPEDIFYGHDTGDVISNSNRPVLLVPAGSQLDQIHKVIFATDYEMADIKAIEYVIGLAEPFSQEVEIIHITDGDDKKNDRNEKRIAFEAALQGISYKGLVCKTVRADHVVTALNRIGIESGGAILAMLHRKHSFFARIFRFSEIKDALANQRMPLLIMPPGKAF